MFPSRMAYWRAAPGNPPAQQLPFQGMVQHHHIGVHKGQHRAEQSTLHFSRPRHNGMVGVGENLFYHLQCLIEIHELFFQKNAQQFGNGHGGVGVVELHHIGFWEVGEVRPMLLPIPPGQCTAGKRWRRSIPASAGAFSPHRCRHWDTGRWKWPRPPPGSSRPRCISAG